MIRNFIRWLNRDELDALYAEREELDALYAEREELLHDLQRARATSAFWARRLDAQEHIIDNREYKLATDHKDYLKLLACILAGKFPDQGTQEEFERALDD